MARMLISYANHILSLLAHQACNAHLCAKIDAQTASLRNISHSILSESSQLDQYEESDFVLSPPRGSGIDDSRFHRYVLGANVGVSMAIESLHLYRMLWLINKLEETAYL